ncbi:MAG: KR domain-containing protein, partial [Sandaracinaceae bacterium]
FKEHVDRGLAELKARLDIDLAPLLFGTAKDAEAELDRMPHQLPAIFIVSVAMARLFESWDVRPDALLGHSLGQNTAAHLAGVMSFSDCLGLVVLRGRLFEKTAEGAMLSVAASASTIEPLLDGALDLAVVNAPDACVVSGPPDAVAALEAKLTEAGEIEVRRLAIPTAAHSRLLDPILGEFGDYLRSIELKAPSIPVLCNTTGGWLTDRDACDPDYWVRHLRSTVRFADDVETVLAGGARILIECGPGRALSSLARGHHAFGKGAHNALHTIRHKDDEVDDQTFFVTALGRIWASGGAFELDRLFEGEERVRVELPTYAWNHKPYFVEPLAPTASAESATDVAREDDVEAWGWRPRWKPAAADPVDRARHTWLLFMDDAGIGRRIEERLRERGDKVVCVYEGDAYVAKTDHHFALSPERGREGYAALVRDLVARGLTPDRVVHLWLLEAQERFRPGSNLFHHHQERGFYSLLFLAQALGEEGVPPLELTVVTNGMQRVSDEPLPYPDKATVLGPVRVIPRELEGYVTRSVDVTMPAPTDRLFGGGLRMALADPFAGRRRAERSLDELSDRLLEELLTAPEAPNGVDVTAWRGDRRFVWTLDPVPLEPVPLEPARETIGALRRGGHYVITGGLGGIGLTIAEALGRASGAKLTLLSRTALPPREQWASWIRQHGESDRVSQRLRRLLDVEAAGAELAVHCADVTHVDELTRALGAATDRFGPIHGLLHTAGTVADELIAMKTPERAQEVLTPKVQGTRVLDEVLAAHPPLDFMVLFSSTSTATAPPGQVDYVAANAFLDAYAQARAGEPTRVTSLHWGIWRGVGMAAEASGQDRGTPGEAVGEQPSHPLLDARVQAANGRSVLEGTLSTARDWVLDGHRTKNGHALLPGTGYLELARAALEAYGERGAFEIEDLFFIRPFAVADDTDRAIRVGLTPTERGYAFEVRGAVELEGQRGWELHAQAQIALRAIARPTPVQPSAIADRCARHERAEGDGSIRTTQEKHLRFGPRWGVLRERWLGDGEGLARLALPDRFANETRELGLHPALLDIATGWAMELIEGYRGDALWVPISYERVRVHAPLPPTIVSHVRNAAPNRDDSDFVSFDVTLATADGQVLVEVDRLSLRKMTGDLDFAVKGRPSRSDVELEARADEGREPSPQERALAQNLERGIQPAEGADAFLRVLAGPARPEIFVSSMPLPALISQAARTGRGSEAGESLKLSRPELDSEFVEARDEVEKTLVTFWQELLGVDTVGVRDSFFDLGGHSLIAVRLFAKVKKAYSVEFPISVLFEAPTIERCASMIKATIGESASAADEAEPKPKATRYTHLVPMHAGDGGPKTPFFLVAGMFGNVLNLRHLAHLVGTDRRFYGLQARGLYGDQTPHETFDEMAKAYLEEMRTVQPSGPYLLGGFSGGGITAYEIAQQLVAAGEEVALLVFLDTPLPFPPPALSLRDRARIQTQQLQEKGAAYLSEWAVNRWNWEVSKLKKRFDEPEPDRTGEEFHDEAIEAAFRRALGRYELRKYPGSVCLFRPRLEVAFDLGEGRLLNHQRDYVYADNGWTKYVGSLDVEEVPGDHDSMVLEPNVRVLAARFRQAIERAEDGLRRRSRDARLAAEE